MCRILLEHPGAACQARPSILQCILTHHKNRLCRSGLLRLSYVTRARSSSARLVYRFSPDSQAGSPLPSKDVSVALRAELAATNGNGAGAVESQLVDSGVLAMLEAVRTGALEPGVAAMQLRERSAGYQQVSALPSLFYCSPAAVQELKHALLAVRSRDHCRRQRRPGIVSDDWRCTCLCGEGRSCVN